MGDVHGGLLKCVLQLAACSDKLRTTDVLLGKFVSGMQRDLPLGELPTLKSTLAVVPVNPDNEAQSKEQLFEDAFERGTEAAERLEVTKARLEKELRRRSDNFREIVSSRNTDIQEEYERMLKELEDQADNLSKEIGIEKSKKRATSKRRREQKSDSAARRKKRRSSEAESERRAIMHELEEHTREIRDLQGEFALLEEQLEREEDDERANEVQSEQDREAVAEERLSNEIAELRQEVALLQEAQQSIADTEQTSSLKAQYEEELLAVDEEIAHMKSVREDTMTQLSSNGVRLHSLLRTLAPSPSIGTLMTRLHQQLSQEGSSSLSTSPAERGRAVRKTAELQAFLNSCPSVEEGKQAIEEMKKLQLIYCYESSGIVALAD
ncbi:hypothetical protein Gpo141_00002686 [Globisporangium polare]